MLPEEDSQVVQVFTSAFIQHINLNDFFCCLLQDLEVLPPALEVTLRVPHHAAPPVAREAWEGVVLVVLEDVVVSAAGVECR